MEQYDYGKLLGRMKEKGITQDVLAECLGIGVTSVNLSLNNKRDFKQEEIVSACKELNIPLSEVAKYFFRHKALEN